METDYLEHLIYKRIILKLSGESCKSKNDDAKKYLWDEDAIQFMVQEIKPVYKLGAQIAIVIGGGNIARGSQLVPYLEIKETTADEIGMLATVQNALIIQDILEKDNIEVRVQSAIEMKDLAEPYIKRRAIRHLEKGRIVIMAGGTGHSKCSTDNAAVIRAYEVNAEAVLKGTKVEGLFDKDPMLYEQANFIPEISYQEIQRMNFKQIIDNSAVGVVADASFKLPIHIFNFFIKGNLRRVMIGEKIGSKIY